MSIARRILDTRTERGIKQTHLDKAAGVSQGTASRYESGQRARDEGQLQVVASFAKVLRVRLEWLVTGEGERDLDPRTSDPRSAAAEIAREAGVFEEAIAAVLAESVAPEDATRSRLYWVDRMRARALELLGAASTGRVPTSTGSFPTVKRFGGPGPASQVQPKTKAESAENTPAKPPRR